METPVLFIVFNRPDTAKIVFEKLRQIKVKKLYIAADGPRVNRVDDELNCRMVRQIVSEIDWDCEIKYLLQDENLGCGKGVSTAISWFFDNVDSGIILEDDCLPHDEFFEYCTELLGKYRDHEKVKFIGGTNYQDGIKRGNGSYYYSKYNHVWGWATWAKVWKEYDFKLDTIDIKNVLNQFVLSDSKKYWEIVYFKMKQGVIDTWDYQLTFTLLNKKWLSIIPNVNLVSNIGFRSDAAHNTNPNDKYANIPTESIFPLIYPNTVECDKNADEYYEIEHLKLDKHHYYKQYVKYKLYKLSKLFKR